MQRRFWAKHVNWNCGFSLSYMPWRFQSVLLSVLYSYRDDLPQKLRQVSKNAKRLLSVDSCVAQKRFSLRSPSSLSKQEHIWFPSNLNIFSTIQSKPALQTLRYYGQFALSLGKESLYIFSKFDPLNMDTFYRPLSVCITVDCKTLRACEASHWEKKPRLFCSPVLQGFDCISFSFWSAEYSDYLQDLRKEDRLYEYNNTKDAMKKILSDFYKNCRLRIEHLKAKHRRELRLLARLKQEATEKGEIAPTSGSLRKISRGVFGFTPRYSSIVQVNGFSHWPFKP